METVNTIAKALALGALALQWAPTHESINRLYLDIKHRLDEKFPSISLVNLQDSPQSRGIQFLLKEDLANVVAGDDGLLVHKCHALINAVTEHNPELLEKLALPE